MNIEIKVEKLFKPSFEISTTLHYPGNIFRVKQANEFLVNDHKLLFFLTQYNKAFIYIQRSIFILLKPY